MKVFAFLLEVILFWLLLRIAQKGWRLFAVLFFAAFITGCVGTSKKFDKSPCACDFENINTVNYRSEIDA